MGTSAALVARFFSELADESDAVPLLQGQQLFLVFQQHHAVRRDLRGHFMLRFLVPGRFGLRVLQIPVHDGQDTLAGPVHDLLVQLSGADGFHNPPVVYAAGSGHLQVQPRGDPGHPVRNRAPVGDRVSVKSPFVPEHFRQQPRVFRSIDAVDPVVGAHHRPGFRFLHRHFKSREIDLPDRTLIRVRGGAHPPVFLAVQGKMLDARAHIPALDALGNGRGHPARQIGVLRKILKIPAAQRAALDIHRRTEHDRNPLMLAAVADGFPHPPDHIRIERGRCGAGGRKTDRPDAVVDPQMVRLVVLLPQAVGAVADHGAGNPQPLHGFGMPEIIPGAQPRLFLQRHLADQFPNVHRD